MHRQASTVLRAVMLHAEIALWVLVVAFAAAAQLRWAAGGALVAVSIDLAGRLWSRRSPVPMPYFMRWVLFLPRGPQSPNRFLKVLRPRNGESILEIGPGVGVHALPVARLLQPDGVLQALDIQHEMLEDVMRRAARKGITNIVPCQADAAHLPFSDSSFDAAYVIGVLGEIPEARATVLELRRVLKKGGRLVVAEMLIDPDFIPLPVLQEMAGQAGFAFERYSGPRSAYSAVFRR